METLNSPQGKHELVSYLKSFRNCNSQELELRANEIMGNVRKVMQPYLSIGGNDPLNEYYAPIINGLETAFQNKDYKNEFPRALEGMADLIELE